MRTLPEVLNTLPIKTGAILNPSPADATLVTGVNTVGTVRVNCLAQLEALLNICANGAEILAILIGSFLLLKALTRTGDCSRKRASYAIAGVAIATLSFFVPYAMNWCVVAARDANLFS